MIPKVIHFCWFGGSPLPPSAKKCVESWQRFCPDYEIRRWDETNFELNACRYVREAFDRKKWAFVSDYARFWVLYQYGGLYFDTDVEMIRGIDDIVRRGSFFGLEPPSPYISGEVCRIAPGLGMGAEEGNPFIKEILDSYEEDSFIEEDGTLNPMTVNTRVNRLMGQYADPDLYKGQDEKIRSEAGFFLYPPDYFCPVNYYTGETKITLRTRTIHHYDAAWKNRDEKAIARIRQKFAKRGKWGRFMAKVLTVPIRTKNRIREDGWKNAWKRALRALRSRY